MKKLLLMLSLLSTKGVLANPACAVCTVAVATSLTLAKKLGLDDCVVGVWAGAMLAMLGFWTIRFFEKKNWLFPGYKVILMGLNLAMISFLYIKDLVYSPTVLLGFLYLDSFLFSTLCGALTLILGLNFYQWLKMKNGGHAHFPFEKVVLPIFLVFVVSLVFHITALCNCHAGLAEPVL